MTVAVSVAYRNLENRLDRLDQALLETNSAQTTAADDLRDMKAVQNEVVHQLAVTQNKLKQHPAATKVARKSQRSVFTVMAGDWLGSAFVVSADAGTSKIVTNYHVVAAVYAAGRRRVEIRQDDMTYEGTITDVSQADDLAVIEVAHMLPALELAPTRAAVGDPVLVLGSPDGLAGTVTSGIVSAYRTIEAASYLQFSAPISPGSSGGPVLDETGHVVGVTVMKDVSDGTEGIGYAIPVERVCQSLDVC